MTPGNKKFSNVFFIVSKGPIFQEVTTIFGGEEGDSMSFRTSVRLYNDDDHFPGIELTNFFDFGSRSVTDLDVFVRLSTEVGNLDKRGKPFFYSDLVRHLSFISSAVKMLGL